jgi:autotransporter-associated beta strand protein
VSAASATHFTISAPATATAGTAFNFTVTALDQFNNTATGYSGTVHFTSTDGLPVLPADSTLTNGVGTFSATLKTAGNQTITAKDTATSSITGTSNTVAVSAASATHFTVSAPATATAGTAFTFTTTAQDQFNNTATAYTGTVHFTSSDSSATLPANSSLINGTGSFSATLRTAGAQTLTGTDTVTSSITGAGTITVNLGSTTIHLLGPGACTAGSNWSNPACWDLNRAPTTGDAVIIDNGAQAVTLNDLGPGIQFASLTINSASGAVTVTGNAIGLQSGATVTDSFNNSGTDTLPGFALNGPAIFSVTPASQTLRISGGISGAFGLTKTGAGTLLLAGTNTYTGTTTVGGGTLSVTGSLANSGVTVGSGGTLTGTGTVQSIAALSGGAVSGNLIVTGNATFAVGSSFNAMLSSNTSFSQLTVAGTTDLTGGPTLNVTLAPGFTPAPGTTFKVIPGTVTGTFTGLTNGMTFGAGGATFRVNYASVTLTVVPGPSSIPALSWWGLGLLGLMMSALAVRVLRSV